MMSLRNKCLEYSYLFGFIGVRCWRESADELYSGAF